MKNRLILILLVAFTLTACTKDMSTTNNNSQVDNNNNTYDDNVYDDEIVDFDEDYDYQEEPDDVPSVLINCKDCVFAFYKDKKTFGSKLTDYTKDYTTIRDSRGKQRRRFLGHIIDGSGNIVKAYACGIEKGKAYCLEGTTNGSAFEYNVGILNQVFSSDECSYNMNNTRYTCIGETNGDTRMDGYVSVHYDENCHIFGKTTDHDAQIYCY